MSSSDVISSPRCLDHFSKRRAALALRQPASDPGLFVLPVAIDRKLPTKQRS